MKPAKTVRLRVSFEIDGTATDTKSGVRSWVLFNMRQAGARLKRLRVERVEKKQEKR